MPQSYDPQALMQSLLGIQGAQTKQTTDAVAGIESTFQQANAQAEQAVNAQREVIGDAAVVAAGKANVEYQQHSLMQQIQSMWGVDPAVADNEIAKNLAVANDAREKRKSVRAEYDALASTDLLSNPIGYLLAQIKLPAAAAKNNALADVEDEALGNINTRMTQVAAAKSTLTANTADQVRTLQLQQAEVDTKLAHAKLDAQEAANSATRGAQEMQLISLKGKVFDDQRSTILGINSIAARAEALDDAREARKDREVNRKLQEENLQLIIDKRKKDAAEEARLNSRLESVSKMLGQVDPMTLDKLRGMANKKEQEAWLMAAQTGQLGDDLKASLEFYLGRGNRQAIQATGGASAYDAAKKMETAALSYEAQASRELQVANAGKVPARKDSVDRAFKVYESVVEGSMLGSEGTEDLSSSRWDHVYNPYRAQFLSFNRAIDTNGKFAPLKDNVVKTTIDDLVKSGSVTTDNLTAQQQQQVMSGIFQKVRARQLDPKKAAADIALYFTNASAYNTGLTNVSQFSLPPQTSYSFTLPGTLGDGNRKKVDLLDPSSVENGIVWQVKQSMNPLGGSPIGGFR